MASHTEMSGRGKVQYTSEEGRGPCRASFSHGTFDESGFTREVNWYAGSFEHCEFSQ